MTAGQCKGNKRPPPDGKEEQGGGSAPNWPNKKAKSAPVKAQSSGTLRLAVPPGPKSSGASPQKLSEEDLSVGPLPRRPEHQHSVYCLMHHTCLHQTLSCISLTVQGVQPIGITLDWEELIGDHLDAVSQVHEAPRTMLEAMAHVSALNLICKDTTEYIKTRDSFLSKFENRWKIIF